jgi:2-oxo-hept-3-ene-1,7-dioate hydratase
MLDESLVSGLAHDLYEAERTRVPIEQLSKRFPAMTVDDGYRISRAWVGLKLADGRKVRGHKIGLTSRAMQRAARIDEPDFGTLLDDMFYEDGARLPFDRFIAPLVEVELAFVLSKPLKGPGVTVFDVLSATEYVVPAVEIIDSRIQRADPQTGSSRRVQDTISDNAANAALVIGGRPCRPDALDLRWVAGVLSRNGVVEETGVGAGVLNNPARGVAWLANRLGRWDEHLGAGELVLSGSFTRPTEVSAGDVFHADFGPLGSLALSFAHDGPSA